jgi:hypothetical protein
MGESIETGKDTMQISNSATSSTQQEASTSQTPKTFTESDIKKAVSDALAKAGREAKALETAKADIAKREADIRKAEQDRELAELEAVKDKPDELSILQRKQKLAADIRAHNAEVERQRQEWDMHQAELTELKAAKYELSINGVADKNGVSADLLKAKAIELGITDPAGIEKLAAIMPKKVAVPNVDSGKTMGGGVDTSNMSPRELITRGLKNNK